MTDRRSIANAPLGLQTGATVLSANAARTGFNIQNHGTNPLFVVLGTGATNDIYHVVLKGSTGVADGSGGVFAQMSGAVYTGIITSSGTAPTYSILEF